ASPATTPRAPPTSTGSPASTIATSRWPRPGTSSPAWPTSTPGSPPYAPPPDEQFDALNATMLRRAGERDGARERWAIGTPYADEPVATVTIATRRPLGLPAKAAGSLTRRRRRGGTATAVLAAATLVAILAAA